MVPSVVPLYAGVWDAQADGLIAPELADLADAMDAIWASSKHLVR